MTNNASPNPYIFVIGKYTTADQSRLVRIKDAIVAAGAEAFLPHQKEGRTEAECKQLVSEASGVIVLLSKDSADDTSVKQQTQWAVTQNKPIFSIFVTNGMLQIPGWCSQLAQYHHITVRTRLSNKITAWITATTRAIVENKTAPLPPIFLDEIFPPSSSSALNYILSALFGSIVSMAAFYMSFSYISQDLDSICPPADTVAGIAPKIDIPTTPSSKEVQVKELSDNSSKTSNINPDALPAALQDNTPTKKTADVNTEEEKASAEASNTEDKPENPPVLEQAQPKEPSPGELQIKKRYKEVISRCKREHRKAKGPTGELKLSLAINEAGQVDKTTITPQIFKGTPGARCLGFASKRFSFTTKTRQEVTLSINMGK